MNVPANYPARLLLVDDDPAQVRLWEHLLRKALGERAQIDAMTDPLAAMSHTQNHGVDILITDLAMPGIGGLDLLRCAKARNRSAQVLLITGESTTESLFASLDLGAVDYLIKPIQPDVLIEVVRQADARLQRWRAALAGTFRRSHATAEPLASPGEEAGASKSGDTCGVST